MTPLTRYLVVIELHPPDSAIVYELTREIDAQGQKEAADAITRTIFLKKGWTVGRARVYELAHRAGPATFRTLRAPEWMVP